MFFLKRIRIDRMITIPRIIKAAKKKKIQLLELIKPTEIYSEFSEIAIMPREEREKHFTISRAK
jgi:hypothetical protein